MFVNFVGYDMNSEMPLSDQYNPLQWCHNGCDSVSNHQPHDCFLNRLFTQIKENIKALRHWPLCGELTGGRWIPRTNGQWRGKCFHLMTSSCGMIRNSLSLTFGRVCVDGFIFVNEIFYISPLKTYVWSQHQKSYHIHRFVFICSINCM